MCAFFTSNSLKKLSNLLAGLHSLLAVIVFPQLVPLALVAVMEAVVNVD